MRVKTYGERAGALMERIDGRLGIWQWQSDGTPLLFRPRTRRERELSAVYFNLVELTAPEPVEA
jgi:hypothetical protein